MERMRNFYHFFLAWLGALVYRFPSKKLVVIGVTGTKGKTSAVELLAHILRDAGVPTAFLSSMTVGLPGVQEKNRTHTTMPGRFFIQRFLGRAVKAKARVAIIEVTSQGVLQHRHQFIAFDGAGFLNLHPEHIEAHGSFESYREAKLEFFRYASKGKKPHKWFFINQGDSSAPLFKEVAQREIISFSRAEFEKEYSGWQSWADWFAAGFNRENAAFAASVAKTLGVSKETIQKAFARFEGFPGRLEWIQKEPFGALVDYAHTPDSLRAVYTYAMGVARENGGGLICVLSSAGGGRDTWKRKEFGAIASHFCKEIFITNEDPYDEPPLSIMEAIKKGVAENKKTHTHLIEDRAEAFKAAVALAKHGDVVIVTGKGSEEYIHEADGKLTPWNEGNAMREALKKRNRTMR